MACRCAPAHLKLKQQLNAAFPGRDRGSDGCCGNAAHNKVKSDHNADASGYAHAYDVDEDLVVGGGSTQLADWIPLLLKDRRTKYVIYERRIWFPDGSSRAYEGLNAHEHHLHHSILPNTHFDTTDWAMPPYPIAIPPEVDVPRALDFTASLPCSKGGYWMMSYEGGIYAYDGAPDLGGYNRLPPHQRQGSRGFYILEPRRDGKVGYVQVATDGSRYAFG